MKQYLNNHIKKARIIVLIVMAALMTGCFSSNSIINLELKPETNGASPFFVVIKKDSRLSDFLQTTPVKLQDELTDAKEYYTFKLIVPANKTESIQFKENEKKNLSLYFLLKDATKGYYQWKVFLPSPLEDEYTFTFTKQGVKLKRDA